MSVFEILHKVPAWRTTGFGGSRGCGGRGGSGCDGRKRHSSRRRYESVTVQQWGRLHYGHTGRVDTLECLLPYGRR